jgi:hypothetical protein
VDNFVQSDLNDEDVFLLDTFTSIFLWIGSQSSQQEKAKALEFAERFIKEADDGRETSIPIIRVSAGDEPPIFTSHFLAWDVDYFKKISFKDPYQAKLDALNSMKSTISSSPLKDAAKAVSHLKLTPTKALPVSTTSAPVEESKSAATPLAATPSAYVSFDKKFSVEDLKSGVEGIDLSRKEEYLDNSSFIGVFGMEREIFASLPKWKRDDLKKKQGLF